MKPERTDVLTRLELRFTQPGALNDPFELRPQFESLISEADFLANLEQAPVDLGPILGDAYAMLSEDQRSHLTFESAAARGLTPTDPPPCSPIACESGCRELPNPYNLTGCNGISTQRRFHQLENKAQKDLDSIPRQLYIVPVH